MNEKTIAQRTAERQTTPSKRKVLPKAVALVVAGGLLAGAGAIGANRQHAKNKQPTIHETAVQGMNKIAGELAKNIDGIPQASATNITKDAGNLINTYEIDVPTVLGDGKGDYEFTVVGKADAQGNAIDLNNVTSVSMRSHTDIDTAAPTLVYEAIINKTPSGEWTVDETFATGPKHGGGEQYSTNPTAGDGSIALDSGETLDKAMQPPLKFLQQAAENQPVNYIQPSN